MISFNTPTADSRSRFSQNQCDQEDVFHLEQQTPTSKWPWCTAICRGKEHLFKLSQHKKECEIGQNLLDLLEFALFTSQPVAFYIPRPPVFPAPSHTKDIWMTLRRLVCEDSDERGRTECADLCVIL